MAEQEAFQFVPLSGELLNLGRIGLELNWCRISRETRKRLRREVQTSALVSFAAGRYCAEAALLEEIRRQWRARARRVRKALGGRTRKPAALVEMCRSAEGRRAQLVMDQLIESLGQWEAARRCG